jgi:predicted flap endonuclease-1-like 5' DNA nuclease
VAVVHRRRAPAGTGTGRARKLTCARRRAAAVFERTCAGAPFPVPCDDGPRRQPAGRRRGVRVAALKRPYREERSHLTTSLVEIEGIAEAFAEKLRAAGIGSIEELLDKGATPSGRDALAETSGISSKQILRWVNHADLFRINGVAGEYAELLEAGGVDTVVELAQRNATNLAAKLAEINEAKHLVRSVPGVSQVEKWVAEAKNLPRAVTY